MKINIVKSFLILIFLLLSSAIYSQNNNQEENIDVANNALLNKIFDLQHTHDSLIRLTKQNSGLINMSNDNQEIERLKQIASITQNKAAEISQILDKYIIEYEKRIKKEKQLRQLRNKNVVPVDTINDIVIYHYKKAFIDSIHNLKNPRTTKVNPFEKKETIKEKKKKSHYISEIDDEKKTSSIPKFSIDSDSLFYMIQIGVFSKKLNYEAFQGIQSVYFEKIDSKELFRYYTGPYYTWEKAMASKERLIATKHKNVFIVAFFKKNKIPVSKAHEIEYSNLNIKNE